MEDSSQGREHGMSLLLHHGKIPADATKSGDPSRTAKSAKKLLLHFGPAQVSLGLVVGKRNALIGEQPYERMNITGVEGLTEAEKTMLRALDAIEN